MVREKGSGKSQLSRGKKVRNIFQHSEASTSFLSFDINAFLFFHPRSLLNLMTAITSMVPCDRCHAGNRTAHVQTKDSTSFFVPLISCAGVGHGVGAHGRGVGGDLPVGARPRRLAAADRTEPGGALGKVSSAARFLPPVVVGVTASLKTCARLETKPRASS